MSNNKQQTAVDSIIELCQELLANHYSISHDAVCSEVIKFCQEQAKEMEVMGKEMSYLEGYKEGYKRACDYMTNTIKDKIEIKENRNFFTKTGTNTTFLCTQFIAEDRITTSLPNCIRCGKPQYQHPIISNTI
jgi:hypothetical protein